MKKVKKCKICGIRPVVGDDRVDKTEDKVDWNYCDECFKSGAVDKLEALKAESKEKITPLTEIETLKELIEREEASVRILLSAASGHDQMENDDVVMTMRDCYDRIQKMEASLGRLSEMVI